MPAAAQQSKPSTPVTRQDPHKLVRPPDDQIDPQCRAVLDQIDQARERLQPTPKVGDIVGWVDSTVRKVGETWIFSPAIVTQILDPGRIVVESFGSQQKTIRNGALYIHHPENLPAVGRQLAGGGGWFYREVLDDDDWKPPKSAFVFHRRRLELREQAALGDLERRTQEQLERQRMREQIAAQQAAAR